MILAGDVGGTKIMLEAGDIRSGAWTPALSRRYESCDMTFAQALGKFMDEWKAGASRRSGSPPRRSALPARARATACR